MPAEREEIFKSLGQPGCMLFVCSDAKNGQEWDCRSGMGRAWVGHGSGWVGLGRGRGWVGHGSGVGRAGSGWVGLGGAGHGSGIVIGKL